MGNSCYPEKSYKAKQPAYLNDKLGGPVTIKVDSPYTTSFNKRVHSTPKVTNRLKENTPPCSPIMIDRHEGVRVSLIAD